MKWEVGKEYKSVNGSSYVYVGPFTRSDGRLAAAFYIKRGSPAGVFDNLAMRNEDGTTDIRDKRNYDIINPDAPTPQERTFAVRICNITGNVITAQVCSHEGTKSGSIHARRRAEQLLALVREMINARP
jgi:hypothetical protein